MYKCHAIICQVLVKEPLIYDEPLNTAESLIKRTWNLRRVMSLPYVEEAINDPLSAF